MFRGRYRARRRRSKPGPDAVLDRDHPLAHGLLFYGLPAHGAGPLLDLARAGRPIEGGHTWTAGPSGLASYRGSDSFSGPHTTDLDLTDGLTVAVSLYLPTALANGEHPLALARHNYTSESDNEGWALRLEAPDGAVAAGKYTFLTFKDNAVAQYLLASTSDNGAGDRFVAGTAGGGTKRIYVNGVEEASGSYAGISSQTANGLRFGNGSPALYLYWAGVWNRQLSAGEVFELWQNPWGLLRRPLRMAYFVLPSVARRPVWLTYEDRFERTLSYENTLTITLADSSHAG